MSMTPASTGLADYAGDAPPASELIAEDYPQTADTTLSAATPTTSVPAIKPVWTLDQIVTNFERYHTVWATGQTVNFTFETAAPVGEPSTVSFGQLTDVEKSFTRAALQLISDVANIKFAEVPDTGVFGRASGVVAYQLDNNAASYEWGDTQTFTRGSTGANALLAAAQVDLNPTAVNARQWFYGGYNFMALIHETLHTLGFPHPGDYNADGSTITYANSAEYQQDSRQYTVMSYFDATSTGANFTPTGDTASYSGTTPLLDDVAALQVIYGANTTTRTGDTVYGYNSNAGNDVFDFTKTTHPIETIYDAGGNDTIDLSGSSFNARLALNAALLSPPAK